MKKIFGLITFIATLGLLFGTSFAKEASFYGSARTGTFFTDYEKENSGITDKTFETAEHKVLGTSRFGAKVTDGDKFGHLELNSSGGIRHLYGTVKVGPGTLILGQTWTPTSTFLSNQTYGDDGLASAGSALSKRAGQITYSVGNFKIGLVNPTTVGGSAPTYTFKEAFDGIKLEDGTYYAAGDTATTKTYKASAAMPAIEFIYSQNFNPVDFTIFGGFNSLEYKRPDGVETKDIKIDSNLFGLQVKATFGPAMVGFNVYQGTNLGYYPTGAPDKINTLPVVTTSTGKVEDTTTLGTSVVGSYKITDMFGVEAGYSMLTSKNDTWKNSKTNASQDDESNAMYIQFPVTVADGFVVTPEYGVYDLKDTTVGETEGKFTYFGVKCQLDF